jgi:hypothetical protein
MDQRVPEVAERERLTTLDKQKLKFHAMLKEQARLNFSSQLNLKAVSDSLNDYRPRNVIGYNQYLHHLHRHSEETLINGVETLYTGHGSSKDDPRLHQLFLDSMGHYPELVSAYNNS